MLACAIHILCNQPDLLTEAFYDMWLELFCFLLCSAWVRVRVRFSFKVPYSRLSVYVTRCEILHAVLSCPVLYRTDMA